MGQSLSHSRGHGSQAGFGKASSYGAMTNDKDSDKDTGNGDERERETDTDTESGRAGGLRRSSDMYRHGSVTVKPLVRNQTGSRHMHSSPTSKNAAATQSTRTWPWTVGCSFSLARLRRGWHRYGWTEVTPFCVAFLFFFIAYWCNGIMQVMCQRREDVQSGDIRAPFSDYNRLPTPHSESDHHKHDKADPHGHYRHPRHQPGEEQQPLPDLFYRNLPFIHYWLICDILAGVFILILAIKFLFFSVCPLRMIIKRFCVMQGLLFLFRAGSIYLTGQTVPLTSCESTISSHRSAAVESLYIMFGLHRTCADLLFSGHAALFTLGFLLIWTYGMGEEWKWLFGWKRKMEKDKNKLQRKVETEFSEKYDDTDVASAQPFFQSAAAASPASDNDRSEPAISVSPHESSPAPSLSRASSTSPSSNVPLSYAATATAAPPTHVQLDETVHERLAREHPAWIPALNAAQDPQHLTVTSCFMLIYVLTGYFFLVSTHFHYSVDVFIGILIASFTFHAYHSTLKLLHEQRKSRWKTFIQWMEHMPNVGEMNGEEEEKKHRIRNGKRERSNNHATRHEHTSPSSSYHTTAWPSSAQATSIGPTKCGRRINVEPRPSPSYSSTLHPASLHLNRRHASDPSNHEGCMHMHDLDAGHGMESHLYVYYSLTQNRYIIKRVRELRDLQYANVQEKYDEEVGVGSHDRGDGNDSGGGEGKGKREHEPGKGTITRQVSQPSDRIASDSLSEQDALIAREEAERRYEELGIDPDRMSPSPTRAYPYPYHASTSAHTGSVT